MTEPDSDRPHGGVAESPSLHAVNRQMLAYWRSKVDGLGPPRKAAIDPTEIPQLLPDLLIYERIAPDHFRVRVIGTRVTARIGVDPTGANIFELFSQRFKASVVAAMNRILDEPCVQITTVKDRFPSGRESLVEVVRLPLSDEVGVARYIISSTAELQPLTFSDPREAPELMAEPVENVFFALDDFTVSA
ncbi:hypothetical protein AY600_09405 [Phormidium willei BDU 130791]|nr:hypothetical protein AY600_09405 [Phormidium willei BDU 130791]